MSNLRRFRNAGRIGGLLVVLLPVSLSASSVADNQLRSNRVTELIAETVDGAPTVDFKTGSEQLTVSFASVNGQGSILNNTGQMAPAAFFDFSTPDSAQGLTKCIFLVLVIGGVIRYFTSAAFRRLFDDIIWFFVNS